MATRPKARTSWRYNSFRKSSRVGSFEALQGNSRPNEKSKMASCYFTFVLNNYKVRCSHDKILRSYCYKSCLFRPIVKHCVQIPHMLYKHVARKSMKHKPAFIVLFVWHLGTSKSIFFSNTFFLSVWTTDTMKALSYIIIIIINIRIY